MDITNLQLSDKPQPCTILHPATGEETDIVILCLSPDHPDYKKTMMKQMRKGIDTKSVKKLDKADIDQIIDQMSANREDAIAAMVTGWKNIKIDGKVLNYSEENAVKLFREYPWMMEQVEVFCDKRENFFGKKKTA